MTKPPFTQGGFLFEILEDDQGAFLHILTKLWFIFPIRKNMNKPVNFVKSIQKTTGLIYNIDKNEVISDFCGR